MSRTFNKNIGLILFGILAIVTSCSETKTTNNQDDTGNLQITDSLMQTKDDLLAGTATAVSYSGFRTGQHPDRGKGAVNPSYEEVIEDLKILSRNSNFKLIRMYDCGPNSEMVIKAIAENQFDIKVMLGMWLDAEISNHEGCAWLNNPIPNNVLKANKIKNQKEIEKGISLANQFPEVVVAVNVGNEALVDWTDHLISVDTVISYVKKVKASIKQPVTVAENYDWWAQKGASLANVVDFISLHTYPLWEGKDIDEAMHFTAENIMSVKRALPNKKIVVSEAGWTDVASEFGERASEDKQLRYFNDLQAFAKEKNITVFFFEAFDEEWKGDPGNMMGAEKHWGLFTSNRKAKKVMQDWYPDKK